MKTLLRKPTSPGQILRDEFLLPLKITQSALAKHIGCDVKVINRIVNERSMLSAEIAVKLSGAFSTTAEFWMNAQKALDLYNASKKIKRIPSAIAKVKLHGNHAA
jgi:addiction module HigA family antidote